MREAITDIPVVNCLLCAILPVCKKHRPKELVMEFVRRAFILAIAGVVLTIGMAVDANVLIFERIREETAKGKSLRE